MIQLKIQKQQLKNFNKNLELVLLVFYICSLKNLCIILGIVAELTDDKSLDKVERKRLQIVNANKLTPDAIIVRLADKISNLRDLNRITPVG